MILLSIIAKIIIAMNDAIIIFIIWIYPLIGLFFNTSIFSETLLNTVSISRMVSPTNKVSNESRSLEIIGFENISRLNRGEEVKKVKIIITTTYENLFKNFFSRNKSSIKVDVLFAIFFNAGKRMLLKTK